MKFKTSYEVITLIEQKKRNGIALRNFQSFMQSIGNPQHLLQCIHIGGTNGKGSTTCVCASILEEAGYKVGTFTSPYLETHHDRIRINNQFIEDEKIVSYANQYYEDWVTHDLSMFEIDMFISVLYFVENKVDFVVFEVGLGGEQDATNIIHSLVSAITNIGMDHMEYLGNTYSSIASTKAGIIKENTTFITSEKREECLTIFKDICKQKNSIMIQCEEPQNIIIEKELQFTYKGMSITQPTLAKYQAMNSSLAMEIILCLQRNKHIHVTNEQILSGIQKAKWKGRFEILQEDPLIIIDGAHNQEGIQALVQSAKSIKDIRILFSALQDKPYASMLECLFEISEDISVCTFDFYRAASLEELYTDKRIRTFQNETEAIDTLLKEKDTPLLICGSLYFISEVRAYILNKIKQRK